jgi:hypothetical protein
MVRYGPALEKKQAQLFRCVDIGAELYAMAAVCSRAHRDARRVGTGNATQLADLFCRQSRIKVERLFTDIGHNADTEVYDVARASLDDAFAWLEHGIVDPPGAPARAGGGTVRVAKQA